MGLDNGLVIRKRNQKVSKEIAYWRKCWNIRGDILDIIDSTEEKYCYEISPSQLLQIVKILSKYNEKNWDHSIWSWDDIKHSIKKQILTIPFWIIFLLLNKDYYCEFYDSYEIDKRRQVKLLVALIFRENFLILISERSWN